MQQYSSQIARAILICIHNSLDGPANPGSPRTGNRQVAECGASPICSAYTKESDSPAVAAAKAILDSRGSGPRLLKNTLAFLATDKAKLPDLDDTVRRFTHFIHDGGPCAGTHSGVMSRQVGPRKGEVQGWLTMGFVFAVKELFRDFTISRFQTALLGGLPSTWTVKRIKDILCEPIVNGVSPQSSPVPPGLRILNVACIRHGECDDAKASAKLSPPSKPNSKPCAR